ncbi:MULTISPECIES: MAE_28990/MAE_18760 family HEPN-like nuclease [Acinetobacter]|jgi:hypothetical protein|uniref:MAE_28990/MAE_18760 family HEPN-like nuclease n=1 Tax=Acinetobacter TaxID=469 RepID=UPI000995BAEB|nr:MAE_28990/MAE_18760 family HEPN-like nuclease [Acinetobacter sp. MF4642]OOW10247.1 hypothetical protein MF4642_07820 [Acinetobacter sp. MF4642]WQN49531.1 MAE_28990/MAE_18760 family HEPN-like nuclease [Acinetobacter johnsonii]
MDINAFRTELEEDWEWRLDELRLLKNLSAPLDDNKANTYRRSLVVFLYAHFEGFFQFALSHYIKTVNDQSIPCAQANTHLVSATIHDVFKALRDDSAKCSYFKAHAPEDTKLHRFFREIQFVENSTEIYSTKVQIKITSVDLESNLSPLVFKKNLYKLGLPHEIDRDIEVNLNKLLGIRNKIVHGERRDGVNRNDYEGFELSVAQTVSQTMINLTKSCVEKLFLKEEFR